MRKMLLMIFGGACGVASVLLYQWMRIPTDDPYFFLTPKPTVINEHYYAIEKPIKLYQKNETVDFVFWDVPQPIPKLFYLLPASSPSPVIMLKIQKNKNINYNLRYFFEENNLITNTSTPLFNIKVYRINDDLTESLVKDEDYTQLFSSHILDENSVAFDILDFHGIYPYGHYRLRVKIVADWPKLNNDDYSYFIHLRQKSTK